MIVLVNDKIDIEIINLFYAIPDWNEDFNFPEDFVSKLKQEGETGVDALRFLRIIKGVVNNVGLQLMKELNDIRYIGPLRDVPPRGFIPHPKAEEDRWADGIAAWDALFNQWVSLKIVNEWLQKLKTGYSVTYKEYFDNPTLSISPSIDELLKKEFEDLFSYSKAQQSDTEKVFKNIQLSYYKKIIEILELFNPNDYDKIKPLISKFHNEFSDLLNQLEDTLKNAWFNIGDEIGCVGDDLKSMIEERTNNEKTNSESLKKLFLFEQDKKIFLEPYDIGVGISQVLPIIVASLMFDKIY